MPKKIRLSTVLDQVVVPDGADALDAFESTETLGRKYPAALDAVMSDADHRRISVEKALEIARGYVTAKTETDDDAA